MAFKDLLTRRKLLKENESLRAENRHLSIELRNARADLALELVTSSVIATKTVHFAISSKPMNHQNPKQSALNVWGLKMPTTTRLFDEKNILRTLAKCLSNIKVGKYFELH